MAVEISEKSWSSEIYAAPSLPRLVPLDFPLRLLLAWHSSPKIKMKSVTSLSYAT